MKYVLTLIALIAAGLGGSTLYFHEGRAAARFRADSLAAVTDSLTLRSGALLMRNAALSARLDTQTAAASRQKEAEIAQLRGTYDSLVNAMQSEISQGQIQITRLADRLNVTMVDKILFPSGEADITPAGLRVLRRVGNVLKTTQGKIIRVEGHTDDVVISSRLMGRFPTNWELSTARATVVTKFMQEHGVPPAMLSAVGYGEFQPIASNATTEGKSLNRRIDIVLSPAEQAPTAAVKTAMKN